MFRNTMLCALLGASLLTLGSCNKNEPRLEHSATEQGLSEKTSKPQAINIEGEMDAMLSIDLGTELPKAHITETYYGPNDQQSGAEGRFAPWGVRHIRLFKPNETQNLELTLLFRKLGSTTVTPVPITASVTTDSDGRVIKFRLIKRGIILRDGGSFEDGEWYVSAIFGATAMTDPLTATEVIYNHQEDIYEYMPENYDGTDTRLFPVDVMMLSPWTKLTLMERDNEDSAGATINLKPIGSIFGMKFKTAQNQSLKMHGFKLTSDELALNVSFTFANFTDDQLRNGELPAFVNAPNSGAGHYIKITNVNGDSPINLPGNWQINGTYFFWGIPMNKTAVGTTKINIKLGEGENWSKTLKVPHTTPFLDSRSYRISLLNQKIEPR